MRGGISVVSKRYPRANYPRVESYNPSKPKSHIHYLDANNLYRWAINQPLPTIGFEWVEDCNRLTETIADHPENSPEGYMLQVDLGYPEDLHDTHNAVSSSTLRRTASISRSKWRTSTQAWLSSSTHLTSRRTIHATALLIRRC